MQSPACAAGMTWLCSVKHSACEAAIRALDGVTSTCQLEMAALQLVTEAVPWPATSSGWMLSHRQPGHKCVMLLEVQCLARMLASWQVGGMGRQAQSAELPVASRARKGHCSRMRRTVRRSWSGTSLGALSGWTWQTLPTPMGMVSMCITAVVTRTIGWLTDIVVLLEASHGPVRSLLSSHRPCRASRQEWPYGIWHAPHMTVAVWPAVTLLCMPHSTIAISKAMPKV